MLPPTIRLLVSWVDGSESTTTTTHHLPAAHSAAAARSAAAALVPRLAAASQAAIVGYSLVWRELFTPAPRATLELNPHGQLLFSCAGIDQYFTAAIPGILPGLLLENTNNGVTEIDTGAAAVQGLYNTLVENGFINPFGYAVAAISAAYAENVSYGRVYIP